MSCSFIVSLIILVNGVSDIDTVNSFVAPLPHVQRRHHRFQRPNSHWRHSGHDRFTSQTRYESRDIVDDIWDKFPIDVEPGLMNFVGGKEEDSVVSEPSALILAGGAILVLVAAGALAIAMRNDLGIELELSQLIKDPSNSFDTILEALETMDPQKGMMYFASFYILAEILAIPAVRFVCATDLERLVLSLSLSLSLAHP